ncbi:penicillin-binding protein 1A [Chitinibacter bivalviorum]|uniref:Penicillin-binding protein 1A n=1 Tax=Chitinibacter bivalviorum TaxID=2739434 RepID=A0A7H9BM56_9NEIS|nr:penicillin-binding protein 1A [Chitinibacter bivalviorum]QLG89717.1 penicillin-binding protein 1A [Chitinibacter bivalviorum]
MTKKILLVFIAIFSLLSLIVTALFVLAVAVTYPKLPSLEALTDYKPKVPLRIFTQDNVLIGEFGEERRAFTPINKVPQQMINALLAAEDERFYEHGGIDYIGVLRAIAGNVISGQAHSGASTITMQVAKNFYLTNEKTFTRKFTEALLSFKIEHNLSKDQILELYINQIYLGQRAYGFASAAQIYYGKDISNLTIAEMAMLAGLPKAPSAYNPVVNPKRAKLRQLYVLRRMHELNKITTAEYEAAKVAPLEVKRSAQQFPVHAEYVAEMVRQMMFERYKDAIYTQGFQVYTTLDSKKQQAAYESLRTGLIDYDTRHGYRGPEGFIEPSLLASGSEDQLDDALSNTKETDDLRVAVVISSDTKAVNAYIKGGEKITIQGDGLKFARSALSDKNAPANRIRPGAIIRVRASEQGWVISQLPQVEGAFVAMNPQQGAIIALVGGFDYNRNNFNHVTQAWRQPGSSFKPFIYSAALERGVTTSTQINDAPLVIDPEQVGGQRWEPKNYDGKFAGMMSVRKALTLSKNLVSIRILQAIGTDYAQQHITRFGFDPKNHPPYLTMALGAGSVTPLQMAEGYSVFANTGFRVRSYFVDRITDSRGNIIAKTQPEIAGQNAPRTLDARNAFIMTSMMGDVIKMGTATKAKVLGRNDMAGKTGTTNDAYDAWFAGFTPQLVAITWIGFDQPRSLGARETGGAAALPVWINFMSTALKDIPELPKVVPDGIITKTTETENGPITEYYLQEYPNTNAELGLGGSSEGGDNQPLGEIKELLF